MKLRIAVTFCLFFLTSLSYAHEGTGRGGTRSGFIDHVKSAFALFDFKDCQILMLIYFDRLPPQFDDSEDPIVMSDCFAEPECRATARSCHFRER